MLRPDPAAPQGRPFSCAHQHATGRRRPVDRGRGELAGSSSRGTTRAEPGAAACFIDGTAGV